MRYASQSGYSFQLITNSNYTTVIANHQDFNTLVKLSHLDSDVTLKGLIQWNVLAQNGGVWIDANTAMTEGLEWLSQV